MKKLLVGLLLAAAAVVFAYKDPETIPPFQEKAVVDTGLGMCPTGQVFSFVLMELEEYQPAGSPGNVVLLYLDLGPTPEEFAVNPEAARAEIMRLAPQAQIWGAAWFDPYDEVYWVILDPNLDGKPDIAGVPGEAGVPASPCELFFPPANGA